MEQIPSNNIIEQLLSGIFAGVASEVPIHLDEDEEVLLSVFLRFTKFETLDELIKDIECFVKEELDLNFITRENVARINFSALATKFGKRYGLNAIKKLIEGHAEELNQLGWKSMRTILVKVLLPELENMPFADAQFIVMTFEDFITKYSLIRGEDPDYVLDQLKYKKIFKDYQFTLELDGPDTQKQKKLSPPDEFIRWAGRKYTVEQAGRDLEIKYKLIVDHKEWIQFFEDHQQTITVVPGELNKLIAVLHQLEYKNLVDKSKNKGCWKIWQFIVVDENGKPFTKKLRQISSNINLAKTQRNEEDKEFGKRVITEMMKIERDNSTTI